jgi:hypothetical protein
MAKAAQTGCDFSEKGRYGALQKQKAALARRDFIEALHTRCHGISAPGDQPERA